MNNIELRETKKDHYKLLLNGTDVTGEQERSTFRHIIQVIDNGINPEYTGVAFLASAFRIASATILESVQE